MNSHFNNTENLSNNKKNANDKEQANKLLRRNGKKLRYRRQPWSGKNLWDFLFNYYTIIIILIYYLYFKYENIYKNNFSAIKI